MTSNRFHIHLIPSHQWLIQRDKKFNPVLHQSAKDEAYNLCIDHCALYYYQFLTVTVGEVQILLMWGVMGKWVPHPKEHPVGPTKTNLA